MGGWPLYARLRAGVLREVDSPSGEDGGREIRSEIVSPPVFLLRKNPAPSSEGAMGACVTGRCRNRNRVLQLGGFLIIIKKEEMAMAGNATLRKEGAG